jgi:hypothetical protein
MALCILLHYKHVLDLALPLYLTESKNRMQFGKAKAHLMISPIDIVAFPFSGQSASFSRANPARDEAKALCHVHLSSKANSTAFLPVIMGTYFAMHSTNGDDADPVGVGLQK